MASWLPSGVLVELVTIDGGWQLCAVRRCGGRPQVVELVACDPASTWSLQVAHLRLAAAVWTAAIEQAKAQVKARLDELQAQAEEREAKSYGDPARQVSILKGDR